MIKSDKPAKNIHIDWDGYACCITLAEELTVSGIKENFKNGVTLSDSIISDQFSLSKEFCIPSNQISVFEKYESRFEYIYVEEQDYSGTDQHVHTNRIPETKIPGNE